MLSCGARDGSTHRWEHDVSLFVYVLLHGSRELVVSEESAQAVSVLLSLAFFVHCLVDPSHGCCAVMSALSVG